MTEVCFGSSNASRCSVTSRIDLDLKSEPGLSESEEIALVNLVISFMFVSFGALMSWRIFFFFVSHVRDENDGFDSSQQIADCIGHWFLKCKCV